VLQEDSDEEVLVPLEEVLLHHDPEAMYEAQLGASCGGGGDAAAVLQVRDAWHGAWGSCCCCGGGGAAAAAVLQVWWCVALGMGMVVPLHSTHGAVFRSAPSLDVAQHSAAPRWFACRP
jgi:hypothetical protein